MVENVDMNVSYLMNRSLRHSFYQGSMIGNEEEGSDEEVFDVYTPCRGGDDNGIVFECGGKGNGEFSVNGTAKPDSIPDVVFATSPSQTEPETARDPATSLTAAMLAPSPGVGDELVDHAQALPMTSDRLSVANTISTRQRRGGGFMSDSTLPSHPSAVVIVRSIASYLSLSDAESMESIYGHFVDHLEEEERDTEDGFDISAAGAFADGFPPPESHLANIDFLRPTDRMLTPADDADAAAGGSAAGSSFARPSLPLAPSPSLASVKKEKLSSFASSVLPATPPTPGLIALSPPDEGWDDHHNGRHSRDNPEDHIEAEFADSDNDSEQEDRARHELQFKQKKFVQQKLTMAVLGHPLSLRSYCLDAHHSALQIQRARDEKRTNFAQTLQPTVAHHSGQQRTTDQMLAIPTKTRPITHLRHHHRRHTPPHVRLLRTLCSKLLDNVPLSILLDLTGNTLETYLDTSSAVLHITTSIVHAVLSALSDAVTIALDAIAKLNPFALVGTILAAQRDAVGRTGEVLVGGIQSVATGVGSASTAAIHHLSRGSVAGGGIVVGGVHSSLGSASSMAGRYSDSAANHSSGLFLGKMNLLRSSNSINGNLVISEKMFRKLNKVDSSASRVLSYVERGNGEALSQHAKKRVQRMMHYHVSLRPFVATVEAPPVKNRKSTLRKGRGHLDSFEDLDFSSNCSVASGEGTATPERDGSPSTVSSSSSSNTVSDSPFMCTPKSFPPTPTSRRHVMARGTRFAEDVVFLARDQLRVEGGLDSDNAQTRAMAMALKEGRRLAVFNAVDGGGNGVALSCGQHCAAKVGNDLYCSTRSMIPILRNCYVYFEMSVSPPPAGNLMALHHASVSIGLSTLEMPLNTLVGAWKGSVGLCTTGQILAAGQWCSPVDPRLSSYGSNSTVGCLVYLDDNSGFETWDGVMVTSVVTFSVNGHVVNPAVSSMTTVTSASTTNPNSTRFAENGVSEHPTADGWRLRRDRQRPFQSRPLTPPPGASPTLPLFVPREEELFPTLTLHSPETQVLCRFCAEDVLAKSRFEIGAPPGVTVYGVDGSVFLDKDVDELYPSPPTISTDSRVDGDDSDDSLVTLSDEEDDVYEDEDISVEAMR